MLTMLEGPDKPVLAMLKKGPKVNNLLYEWPTDKYLDAVDSAEVDGKDVENFGNADEDYAILSNRIQLVRPQGAAIGELAQEVQNQAGVKDKLGLAIKKKLEQVWASLEAALCSDNDAVAGSGTVGSRMRGIGKWIDNSLTISGAEGTITPYLASSSAILTGAISGLTEPAVQNVLTALYSASGKIKTYQCVCGTSVKRAFTELPNTQKATSNVLGSIRTYSQPERKIVSSIDAFVGDFGTLELVPSQWLAKFTSGSVSALRAYILDVNYWDVVWLRGPRVVQLENKGGGPRFFCDAVIGLRCYMPLYNGKFAFTS